MAGFLVGGCATARREKPAESTLRPFEAQKVAQLSHDAYKLAWDAYYWARQDLRRAAFQPTELDWDTVDYLDRISRQVPWVAQAIEKHPATPRRSSRRAYNYVRFDTTVLKQRYHPTSFQPSTDSTIEKLIRVLDEIASYYEAPAGAPHS